MFHVNSCFFFDLLWLCMLSVKLRCVINFCPGFDLACMEG